MIKGPPPPPALISLHLFSPYTVNQTAMCGKQIVLKYERRAAPLQNRRLSSQNAWILQTGELYEYNLHTHAPGEISCVVFISHIIWLYQKISQFVSAPKNHTYTHSATFVDIRYCGYCGLKRNWDQILQKYRINEPNKPIWPCVIQLTEICCQVTRKWNISNVSGWRI